MTGRHFILVAILCLISEAAAAQDDPEIVAELAQVRQQREEIIATAHEKLVTESRKLIEAEGSASLPAQKTSAQLEALLAQYWRSRAQANDKMLAAYSRAAALYGSRQMTQEATAMRAARAKFQADNFPAVPKAIVPVVVGKPKPEEVDAHKYFAALVAAVSSRVADINKMDTSVRKDESHKAMIKGLDDYGTNKIVTFHFPIKDVAQSGTSYELTLGKAVELEEIPGQTFGLHTITLQLSPDLAQSISAKSQLTVRGAPRFDGRQTANGVINLSLVGGPAYTCVAGFVSEVSQYRYGIYVQNPEYRIDGQAIK